MALPVLQSVFLPLCPLETLLSLPFVLPAFSVGLSHLYYLPDYWPVSSLLTNESNIYTEGLFHSTKVSLREVRSRDSSKNRDKNYERKLPTDSFHLTYTQVAFLYNPGTFAQGRHQLK